MSLPRRDEQVTIEQAFHALHYFVQTYWERVERPDELSDILSDTQILKSDLGPADPGSWSDFLKAIDQAREEGPPFMILTKD